MSLYPDLDFYERMAQSLRADSPVLSDHCDQLIAEIRRLQTAGPQPVFEHDCDDCTFIGHVLGHDLWICPQGGVMPTLLARWGNDGPEYQTMAPDIVLGGADQLHISASRAALGTLLEERA